METEWNIRDWWNLKMWNRKKARRAKRARRADEQAQHRVQAREFDGYLYLCFDNVPLLAADRLSDDLAEAVNAARMAVADYLLRGEDFHL